MSRQGPLSNREYQGKLKNRAENIERTRRRDLLAIMSMAEGRRFMYDLLFNRCNLMAVYGGQDSGIYRHEGRRALAVEMGAELQEGNYAPLWVKMVEEHLAELQDDAVVKSAALAAVPKNGDDNE